MQFNLKIACFPGLLPVPTFYLESLSPFKGSSNIQKWVPTPNPEHFLFRWIVLRVVIWHLFWRFEPN